MPSFEDVEASLAEPLRRYLRRMVGDPSLAEDLHQETLLRIARGLSGYEGRASVKNWAFAIATRVVADHFRKPEASRELLAIDEAEPVPDGGAPLEQRLVADEMNACIREVIDSLPPDYRAALVLHELEGVTATTAAEILGCSLPTAKIRIHRARRRLKDALERECEFYHDENDVLRCDRKDS
jgi:RNA polymerase sigma-70 factor (ECF subfamily)